MPVGERELEDVALDDGVHEGDLLPLDVPVDVPEAVTLRNAAQRSKEITRVTGRPRNILLWAAAVGAPEPSPTAATASQLAAPPGRADLITPLCTSMLGTSPVTLVYSTQVNSARLHE